MNLVVIGGKTGTGKTRLLSLLEKFKYQTIDLEGFACHRGSTFGGLGMKKQPSNEQFENIIAEKLNSFNAKDLFIDECCHLTPFSALVIAKNLNKLID